MVDSNDRERIGEAQERLVRVLVEDELRDVALLILANKQVSVLVFGISSIRIKMSSIFFPYP